ncbi:hypothetical protein VTK73DRAFT_9309 [Phialemonium thermophilum]|uniref:Major facilitator superfamily (MFS) profile domain-containing protein n=1 Tax=Phialemonium thermophilum TaxID=223376 RepID=A0ABR3W353_9PEZI
MFSPSTSWDLVPNNSNFLVVLLVLSSCVTATVIGYDGSMMNGLNILPSYTAYFELTTTTLALNTSSVWLGAFVASVVFAKVPDYIGRRPAMFWASVLTLLAAVVQAAAQNVAMFVVGRILIGFGTGCSSIAAPVYLAETLPLRWRGWGLGIVYDFWYVGGLIAAGVTYGTARMDSTWAWRLPSALQGLFTILCILIVPFIPESPRWLADHGRHDECLRAIAKTYAHGRTDDPTVLAQYREIVDLIAAERERERLATKVVLRDMVLHPPTRKRILLGISVSVIAMLSGNNIISYYLGTMLNNAGITSSTTQLQINVILNAFCLVCSLVGTWVADRAGRKSIAIGSTVLLTVFLFLVGGLTKAFGTSSNTAGIYSTVAMIFLFQGSYSAAWTPMASLYPPEVMNYSMRSLGMGVCTAFMEALGLFSVWVFPFALEAIGWKTFMINGAWDFLELAFVVLCWVETKGLTLEEIDEVFDPDFHGDLRLEAGKKGTIEGTPVDAKDASAEVAVAKA